MEMLSSTAISRWFPITTAIAMLLGMGCTPRLKLLEAYADDADHRLYLFADHWYMATVGDANERFYRRAQWATGKYEVEQDSSLVLTSNWPEVIPLTVTCDSLCTKGTCLRLLDRDGYAIRSPRMEVHGDTATWEWSDAYSMFYSTERPQRIHVRDPDGLLNLQPLDVPDTGCHSLRITLDLASHEVDDRCVLRYLHLRRVGAVLKNDSLSAAQPYCDPRFTVLRPIALEKDEVRSREQQGWRLAQCGHPDRSCRKNPMRVRVGPVLLPPGRN